MGSNLSDVVSDIEKDCAVLIEWFSDNQMQANPSKFQAIAIGKKSQVLDEIKIGNTSIKCEKQVKLLGVNIDFELKFNDHISEICKKGARQLNALKRIGKHLNRLCKLSIYYSFIMSNFNFCSLAWHFCSEKNTVKIEKIQERALRFIYSDYKSPYENLLSRSKLPSLRIRRVRSMAIQMFQIINNQSPVYLNDFVELKNSKYNFRYKNLVDIPRVRTSTYGIKSFRYTAAKLWNDLPDHFRTETSFSHFKSLMSSWNGKACSCSACENV